MKKRSIGVTIISILQVIIGIAGFVYFAFGVESHYPSSFIQHIFFFLIFNIFFLMPYYFLIALGIITFKTKPYAWGFNLVGNSFTFVYITFFQIFTIRGITGNPTVDFFMHPPGWFICLVYIAFISLNTFYFTRPKVKEQFT
ncbi:hypothetical protein ACFL1E_02855 [Candidatus Omnitrophota bacterium]